MAILDIPAQLSKTGLAHASIIPREPAERILHNAREKGYDGILPNAKSRWEQITQLAGRKYKIRLTSHYFRKRFETRAEKIPANLMNPNHWMILMGCKPTYGHMPDIYSLMDDHELIAEYETHLAPPLNLNNTPPIQAPSETEQLRRTIAEQNETIKNLTKLLTQLAANR